VCVYVFIHTNVCTYIYKNIPVNPFKYAILKADKISCRIFFS